MGYSRAGAKVLIFSKETEDLLAGIAGCLERLGALPRRLVWDRQAGIHGHAGRPSEAFAAFCGQLKVAWRFCEPADPRPKGRLRLQGYAETNFEPGRRFANELDFQDQLDAWFARVRRADAQETLRARPVDRLAEEHRVMAALPAAMPDTAKRVVIRIPPDPHLRIDTNDYFLSPGVRRSHALRSAPIKREIWAVVLDTGEIA